jgi:hypothetical protein
MYIDQVDAPSRYACIDQEGEDGNGAFTAEGDAFKIDLHGWRGRNWRGMADREPVDQIADLPRGVYDLCFDVLYTE